MREQIHLRLPLSILGEIEIETYDMGSIEIARIPQNLKNIYVESAIRHYSNYLKTQRRSKMTKQEVLNLEERERKGNDENANPLTEIENLSTLERREELFTLRQRQLNGETLSDADLHRGLLLVRADRADRKGRVAGTRKPGRKTQEVKPLDFDDFA